VQLRSRLLNFGPQICVALNTPGIRRSQFSMAEIFLKNSGHLSLRIDVFIANGHYQSMAPLYCEQIIQLLNAHSGRWRHLKARLPRSLVLQLTGAIGNSHSHLEVLILSGFADSMDDMDDEVEQPLLGPLWKMKGNRPSPLKVKSQSFTLDVSTWTGTTLLKRPLGRFTPTSAWNSFDERLESLRVQLMLRPDMTMGCHSMHVLSQLFHR